MKVAVPSDGARFYLSTAFFFGCSSSVKENPLKSKLCGKNCFAAAGKVLIFTFCFRGKGSGEWIEPITVEIFVSDSRKEKKRTENNCFTAHQNSRIAP